MDEVIYLEQDEEIPTVIDKLKNLSGKSVALVIPKGAAVLQSVVNLKILKLEAENLQKEIALVTQDKIGRNLASQVGLSVYDNIQSSRPIIQSPRPEPDINETIELDLSAQDKQKPPANVQVHHYDEKPMVDNSRFFAFKQPDLQDKKQDIQPTKQLVEQPQNITEPLPRAIIRPLAGEGFPVSQSFKPQRPHQKKRLGKTILICLLVVLGLAGFYIYYPKAIITISLQSQPLEKDLTIIVDNNINKAVVEKSSIPGELQEVENEVKQTVNATGSKETGEKAKGTITVYNSYDSNSHSFASGTSLSSNDKTYLADSAFTVPGATVSAGKLVAGRIDVSVTAQNSGESYNLTASDFTISGAPDQISGKSSQTFSGGTSRKITIVSSDDINGVKETLTKQITASNLAELRDRAGDQLISDDAVSNDVISFSTSKNSQDEASSFEATLKIKSRTLSYLEQDYRQMIVAVLNQQISADKELILSAGDKITTSSSVPDFSTGAMNLNGKVTTNIVNRINDQEVKAQIKGKNQSSAATKLSSLPGVSSVKITFRPTWLKSIPRNQKNIVINKEVR